MNKEISALDLAISKLQEEREKALKRAGVAKKEKEKADRCKISAKDKSLISRLSQRCKWWRDKGMQVERSIKLTVKSNIVWTEDKRPYIDGYDIYFQGEVFNLDEVVRGELFEKELQKAQKEIDHLCEQADSLEEKYKPLDLNIFT